ncbi:MAG: hypothetical protein Q8M02_06495 [Candidatus Didemnitutus sp.]|nr:hypothetical protein [Candidatus Didemnitutus sp.]
MPGSSRHGKSQSYGALVLYPIAPQSEEERKGSVWSISSRTHDALVTAEARFGLRDPEFVLRGYVFDGKFPRLGVDLGAKSLLLILADYTEQDFTRRFINFRMK